jgi:hypothetical protein
MFIGVRVLECPDQRSLLVALSMKNIKKILQILIADNGHRLLPSLALPTQVQRV